MAAAFIVVAYKFFYSWRSLCATMSFKASIKRLIQINIRGDFITLINLHKVFFLILSVKCGLLFIRILINWCIFLVYRDKNVFQSIFDGSFLY